MLFKSKDCKHVLQNLMPVENLYCSLGDHLCTGTSKNLKGLNFPLLTNSNKVLKNSIKINPLVLSVQWKSMATKMIWFPTFFFCVLHKKEKSYWFGMTTPVISYFSSWSFLIVIVFGSSVPVFFVFWFDFYE